MSRYRPDDFELKVLRAMANTHPQLGWGGAVGQALECLEGAGLIHRHGAAYWISQAGLDAIERDNAQIIERFWFVMGPSARTIDGAMPVITFECHDQAAEWALRYPECWLEPGYSIINASGA